MFTSFGYVLHKGSVTNNANIEAKKWAEYIKTKETGTADIHEADMLDGQHFLLALENDEGKGKPEQAMDN